MIIVYMQADMRYNEHLLDDFLETKVIGHVVSETHKCKYEVRVVAELYKCEENEQLFQYLKEVGVEVVYSDIENITDRIINFSEKFDKNDYIFRVLGEAVLIDMERCNEILEKLFLENGDYYFYGRNDGTVVDIVRAGILTENSEALKKHARYYNGLKEINGLKSLKYVYDSMPIRLIASNRRTVSICESILRSNSLVDFKMKIKEVIWAMFLNNTTLTKNGFFWSVLTEEVKDNNNNSIPWLVYSAVTFLDEKLTNKMTVFEYGCGNSTIWLSKRVKRCISVEHNHEWYQKIKNMNIENSELNYVELEYDGLYCREILRYKNQIDVVLIDGRDRVRCIINAVEVLKEGVHSM